jgi:Arf-GAP/SH3 domain/ANK repeat/PH domain-containing protein
MGSGPGQWMAPLRSCGCLGRNARRSYIVVKYVERRFARRSTPEPHRLWTAICSRDLLSVLEAFASGQDFGQLLRGPDGQVRSPSQVHL